MNIMGFSKSLKIKEIRSMNKMKSLYNHSRIGGFAKFFAVAALCLAPFFGWGQTPGVYYIDNYNNHNQTSNKRYYLIPADDPDQDDYHDAFYSSNYSSQNGDPERPFLTTYKTNKDAAVVPSGVINNLPNNSVWVWEKVVDEDGEFFRIIHLSSGKYVVHDPPYSSKPNRASMHLLATDSPGENAKFAITQSEGGYYIRPKSVTSGNRYFNPSGSNKDYYHGQGGNDGDAKDYEGLIGLWSNNSNPQNSRWFTEATLLLKPTINMDASTNIVTVTDNNSLPRGYKIRYEVSTDPAVIAEPTLLADPTASSDTMTNGQDTVTQACVIKAVVERYGVVLTEVATETFVPTLPDAPSFDLTCTDRLIITCSSHPSAQIYYTKTSGDGTQTDPDDPDPANHVGTLYEGPLTLAVGDKVKAIACLYGTLYSDVSLYEYDSPITHTDEPTIERTDIDEVTITGPVGSKIYYTTNGEDPEISGDGYDSPKTFTYDESNLIEVRAVAKAEGMEASCVGRRFMVPQPTSVTVTDEDCTSTSPQCNKLVVTLPEGVTNARYAVTAGDGSAAPNIDAVPNPYILYTGGSEGLSLDYLDGSNEWYTVHVYAVKSSDHSYQAESVSHQMTTSGKPVLTPPVGSSPIVGISGGVFGDVAVCTIDMGTPEDEMDDIVEEVSIASNGTAQYSIPNNAVGTLTVAFQHGVWQPSCGATYAIPAAPAKPTWSQSCDNKLSLHTTSPMAVIHYTIDGTAPTLSSPTYTEGCLYNIPINTRVRAKAFQGFLSSAELDYTYQPIHVNTPQFFVNGTTVTLSIPTGTTVYYTQSEGTQPGVVPADPADPDPDDSNTHEYDEDDPITITGGNIITVFKAIAIPSNPAYASCVVRVATREGYSINSVDDLDSLSEHPGSYFFVLSDVDATGFTETVGEFTGVLDGNYYVISNLSVPLFNTINGSTDHNAAVLNVMLKNVTIETTGNAGAIAKTADGYTRIYNCGILPDNPDGTTTSSISGATSGIAKVGGLVGELKGTARVINCFSYANVTGGSHRGGIVGYNAYGSTNADLRTMVMNCMFYGDISTTGNVERIAPVYGGEIISNSGSTGLNNFNYFRFNSPYVESLESFGNRYNCALGAQDRFLERFEFFRYILNSNRKLAMWYVSGSVANAAEEMGHWVLDKSVAPYPILKEGGGVYPSIINPDAAHAIPIDPDNVHRNEGRKLGELTVNISTSNTAGGGVDWPSGITFSQTSFSLNVIDKDEANYNFNYKKVQLPYYHEVGDKNYTDNKVVTGWKIIEFTGGTPGEFATGVDAPAYNFVDRACTNKDLYGTNGSYRVFNQGAYYEVPDGVTAITIEPYWAKCVYLRDATYDVTYGGQTACSVNNMGVFPEDDSFNDQDVYHKYSDALTHLEPGSGTDGYTVYDAAVVLVGNYHEFFGDHPFGTSNTPITIMSADLDNDNEPDNTFFYQHDDRRAVMPIRFDFINIPGIGMAQKENGATTNFQPGIFRPTGWFEITNTVLIHFGQFEYADKEAKTIEAPLILHGGLYEQFVSARRKDAVKTNYILIGGNAWFKNFANGCHTGDAEGNTPKVPISVAGGDYEHFYLSGIYRPQWGGNDDNAECYIDGGRFDEVAGAGMQIIKGNVTWLINAADIKAFYGGGINDANPVGGHISTTISNSYVDEFCGGPKFGNVQAGKLVTNEATNCHFGNYFGAGYGGTSINRVGVEDLSYNSAVDYTNWNTWVTTYYHRAYQEDQATNIPTGTAGSLEVNAISVGYDYEYFFYSGGTTLKKVARFYINFASLSTASTNDVTSTLRGCTIGNFYGGGKFGAVNGDVESTLTDCTVTGDAFGSGYSGAVATCEVLPLEGFDPKPHYDNNAGVFNDDKVAAEGYPEAVVYTWTHAESVSEDHDFDEEHHYIYTTKDLTNLGAVLGNATLTINGNSVVHGDVYGGGALSSSNTGTSGGTTQVNIDGGSFGGNIYGGGKGDKASLGTGHSDVAVTEDVVVVNIGNDSQSSNNVVFTNLDTKGSVFGGNNINGTPKGDATVNIYVTKHDEHNAASYTGSDATFAIADVFGGGNEANYEPSATTNKVTVNIFGCENTVRRVFGGGNAAAAGSSTQDIDGVYTNIEGGRFYQVFGGGNGERGEDYGANIYGDVNLGIHGGNVGQSFGGSNQHGTITGDINIVVDNTGPCEENNLLVNEFFCGGNYVDITGDLVTDILCSDGMEIENLYGGCNQADISGNVVLNVYGGIYTNVFAGSKGDSITQGSGHINKAANILGNVTLNLYGGTIKNAFGGSNVYGNINGRIVVNVLDEEGSCPLYVTNIYGGSNETNYTPTSALVPDHVSPIVNVIHAKYGILGNVYGGSKGIANAVGDDVTTVTAYPLVNIGYDATSMEQYIPEDEPGNNVYTVPAYPRAIISGSVFGGGDAAKIDGNTVIYLRNRAKVFGNIYGGGNMGEVTGNTKVIVNGANN